MDTLKRHTGTYRATTAGNYQYNYKHNITINIYYYQLQNYKQKQANKQSNKQLLSESTISNNFKIIKRCNHLGTSSQEQL